MATYESQLLEYTEISNNKNFKISGTDVNADVTLTKTTDSSGKKIYNRAPTPQDKNLANVKPRKKFKFTYVQPKIINFKPKGNSSVKESIDNLNSMVNSYKRDDFNGYMSYARREADGSGHVCGPTHDEKVKWRLRDIQSQQLGPKQSAIINVENKVRGEPSLNEGWDLNTINTDYATRLSFLKTYISNLGTEAQIKKSIKDYYQYLIDAVNTNRAIVEDQTDIIVYTNLQYDNAEGTLAQNEKILTAALTVADNDFSNLYTASIDKTKNYYKEILSQNAIVTQKVNNVKDFGTKMDREFDFRQGNITTIDTTKKWLFIIFYVLLAILLILCYFAKTRYELMGRIFIILCLGAFPFVAYTIEYYLYNGLTFLYSFILNKPYKNNEKDYDLTKGSPVNGDILSLNKLKTTDGKEKELIDPQNNFDDLEKSNYNLLSSRSLQTFFNDTSAFVNNLFNGINTSNIVNSLANGQ
jgi:hypothetical protein